MGAAGHPSSKRQIEKISLKPSLIMVIMVFMAIIVFRVIMAIVSLQYLMTLKKAHLAYKGFPWSSLALLSSKKST